MRVSSHLAEEGRRRAEVHDDGTNQTIKYFDNNGILYHTKISDSQTISEMQSEAAKWASEIKVLNG